MDGRTRTLTVPILDPLITSTHLTLAHPPIPPPPSPPFSAHSVTYGKTLSSANSDNTTRSYQTPVNLRSRVLKCTAGVLKITRLCLLESLLHLRKVIWLKPTRRGDSTRQRQRRRKEEKTTIRHFQTERTILPLI